MTLRQGLWLTLAAILSAIPTFYFAVTRPNSLPFWLSFILPAIIIHYIRSRIQRRATYEEALSPLTSERGFEIVSSTALKGASTGPFPRSYVFSQPYVSTDTPIGSGEFVEYRRLVLRDTSGTTYTTYALLEFKAFRCSRVLFKPELESLRSGVTKD